MAHLVGPIPIVGAPGEVHSEAKNPIGARAWDEAYNEYIYLKGVASTAIGTWVCFDELGVTTRMVTTTTGPAAIATAATVASTWGWYQIYGTAQGLALTGFADNGLVRATATDGSVDDVATESGEIQVFGAIGRSAVNETTLLATFQIYYPYKSLATLD